MVSQDSQESNFLKNKLGSGSKKYIVMRLGEYICITYLSNCTTLKPLAKSRMCWGQPNGRSFHHPHESWSYPVINLYLNTTGPKYITSAKWESYPSRSDSAKRNQDSGPLHHVRGLYAIHLTKYLSVLRHTLYVPCKHKCRNSWTLVVI